MKHFNLECSDYIVSTHQKPARVSTHRSMMPNLYCPRKMRASTYPILTMGGCPVCPLLKNPNLAPLRTLHRLHESTCLLRKLPYKLSMHTSTQAGSGVVPTWAQLLNAWSGQHQILLVLFHKQSQHQSTCMQEMQQLKIHYPITQIIKLVLEARWKAVTIDHFR